MAELELAIRKGTLKISKEGTWLCMTTSGRGSEEAVNEDIMHFLKWSLPDGLNTSGQLLVDKHGVIHDDVVRWHAEWKPGNQASPQVVGTSMDTSVMPDCQPHLLPRTETVFSRN